MTTCDATYHFLILSWCVQIWRLNERTYASDVVIKLRQLQTGRMPSMLIAMVTLKVKMKWFHSLYAVRCSESGFYKGPRALLLFRFYTPLPCAWFVNVTCLSLAHICIFVPAPYFWEASHLKSSLFHDLSPLDILENAILQPRLNTRD